MTLIDHGQGEWASKRTSSHTHLYMNCTHTTQKIHTHTKHIQHKRPPKQVITASYFRTFQFFDDVGTRLGLETSPCPDATSRNYCYRCR